MPKDKGKKKKDKKENKDSSEEEEKDVSEKGGDDGEDDISEDMQQLVEKLKAKGKRKMIDLKRIALTRLENYNKIEGNKISFAEGLGRTQRSDYHNTVVLKQRITRGFWNLKFQVNYLYESKRLAIGVAPYSLQEDILDYFIGYLPEKPNCSLIFSPEYLAFCVANKTYILEFEKNTTKRNIGIKDGDIVTAELNMRDHTLYFFRGTRLIEGYVGYIPDDVNFAFGSEKNHNSVTVLQFMEISKPTATPIGKEYDCKTGETYCCVHGCCEVQ